MMQSPAISDEAVCVGVKISLQSLVGRKAALKDLTVQLSLLQINCLDITAGLDRQLPWIAQMDLQMFEMGAEADRQVELVRRETLRLHPPRRIQEQASIQPDIITELEAEAARIQRALSVSAETLDLLPLVEAETQDFRAQEATDMATAQQHSMLCLAQEERDRNMNQMEQNQAAALLKQNEDQMLAQSSRIEDAHRVLYAPPTASGPDSPERPPSYDECL